jgi:glutamate racemase
MAENDIKPIGIFDSGYGGLTIMKEIVKVLPQYDYIYLGDNARAPYGTRSFETVYKYTLQAVEWFFNKNCHLVILACNTASAKALRSIQQKNLPLIAPQKRVLGVIRPVTEDVDKYTRTKHVGVLGTLGTVNSNSYPIEINKSFPEVVVTQEACPMWVPLVESGEFDSEGADYFVKKHLENIRSNDSKIDALVLGCTHYPILLPKIKKYLPNNIKLISQGEIVSGKLADYLVRHPEIENNCSKSGIKKFYTTDSVEIFSKFASLFFGETVNPEQITLS